MKEMKIRRDKPNFIGKKTKRMEKRYKYFSKDSCSFENDTDLSSHNISKYEEKKIITLDKLIIPSFFNDITKYDDINREIANYYKAKRELGSQELADLYLIDVKKLYERKRNIK